MTLLKRFYWRNGAVFGLLAASLWFAGKAGYMEAKAELAQHLLEQAWMKRLQDGREYKPWPWADTTPIARLSFPDQDLHFVVLSGASGRNLAFAPAHMSASVMPGQNGVSVIGGHRDTHFAFLQWLHVGDQFELQNPNGKYVSFEVEEIIIADVRRSEIRLDSQEPVLALVACYPFDSSDVGGPLRYMVLAKRCCEEPASKSVI